MREGSWLPGLTGRGDRGHGACGRGEIDDSGEYGKGGSGLCWGCTRGTAWLGTRAACPCHVSLGVRDVAILGWGCTFSSLTCVWDTCPHRVTCDPTVVTLFAIVPQVLLPSLAPCWLCLGLGDVQCLGWD